MLASMSSPAPVSQRSRWPYISLIPFGFGAWAPIYAGVKAGQRNWVALGILWSALIVVALILAGDHQHDEQRLRDRRRALELARTNPALAREIGIGRPDRQGAADAG